MAVLHRGGGDAESRGVGVTVFSPSAPGNLSSTVLRLGWVICLP